MQLLLGSQITNVQSGSEAALQEKKDIVKALRDLSMNQLLEERHAHELFLKTIKHFNHNVVYLFCDLIGHIRLNEISVARALLDAASNGNTDAVLRCDNIPILVLYEVKCIKKLA